jgi:hypothetical protein
MFTEQQQATQQMPVSGTAGDSSTVLPIRFAQTSGAIVPTMTEQATTQQMIYTPAQMLTISGTSGPFTD